MALTFTLDSSRLPLGAAIAAAATLAGALWFAPAGAKEAGRDAIKPPNAEQVAQHRRYDRHRWTRRDRHHRDWGRHDNRRIVVPPRHHRPVRRWAIGRPLPRDYHPYRYDHWAARGLRRPPRGHYYVRIDNDLLLVRIIDRAVIRLMFSF